MHLTKKQKRMLRPILHLVVVAGVTIYFIYKSSTGAINSNTPVPPLLERLIDFMVSLRGFWLLPAVLLLVLLIAFDFSDFKRVRGWLYKIYLVFLGFLTGKLYTMGALYLGYAYSARHVAYLESLDNPVPIGLGAVLLGLVIWFGGRALALAVIRRRSNNSFKPKPLRGSA